MEKLEILQKCRRLAAFLSRYSLGNVKEQADSLIKQIDRYIEDEKLYGENIKNSSNNMSD